MKDGDMATEIIGYLSFFNGYLTSNVSEEAKSDFKLSHLMLNTESLDLQVFVVINLWDVES